MIVIVTRGNRIKHGALHKDLHSDSLEQEAIVDLHSDSQEQEASVDVHSDSQEQEASVDLHSDSQEQEARVDLHSDSQPGRFAGKKKRAETSAVLHRLHTKRRSNSLWSCLSVM